MSLVVRSMIYVLQCESDLAEAIPALEAALAALNTLKVRLSLSQASLIIPLS